MNIDFGHFLGERAENEAFLTHYVSPYNSYLKYWLMSIDVGAQYLIDAGVSATELGLCCNIKAANGKWNLLDLLFGTLWLDIMDLKAYLKGPFTVRGMRSKFAKWNDFGKKYFDDPTGEVAKQWMAVTKVQYRSKKFSLLPYMSYILFGEVDYKDGVAKLNTKNFESFKQQLIAERTGMNKKIQISALGKGKGFLLSTKYVADYGGVQTCA